MAITATDAVDLLRASGLPVEVKSFADVAVAERNLKLRIRQQPPAPSAIRNDLADGLVLYVVPRMTEGLRKLAAEDPRIAFASIHDGTVIFNGREIDTESVVSEPKGSQPRRTPWVRYALLRALLRTRRPRTQIELAMEAGGTQAAISLHLRNMRSEVARRSGGWVAEDPEDLAAGFLDEYPGSKGISQHWFSHRPVMDQVHRVSESAPRVLVSGDAGADQIAPWRSPRTAVLYTHAGLDLASLGFAEAAAETASLTVTVPADPTIWATAKAYHSLPTVDPLICAYDVRRAGGSDARDAVQRILERVLDSWAHER